MDVSSANENGVVAKDTHEVIARIGRCYAAVNLALCEDGLYRYSVEMQYSYGGFSGPIWIESEGYPTASAARTAGLEELLHRWYKPFPSDPQSAQDELRILREQIEAQLKQPSLF
jgi:hypothetical protein